MGKGILRFWAGWLFFACWALPMTSCAEKTAIIDQAGAGGLKPEQGQEVAKAGPLLAEPPHDQTWTEPVTGMQFVWVKPGCFQMGCGAWSRDCEADEKPVHEVCVDGFWMGKTEVTQEQWRKVMGENPSRSIREGEYPVEQISFGDAEVFIRQLGSGHRSHNIFRLPTEAEWEYAARSGGQDELYAGGAVLAELGWHSANADEEIQVAGSRKANKIGLFDMSGNVYEWCSDWYAEGYYGVSPKSNPLGPASGDKKVIRGGAAASEAKNLRTTNRGRNSFSCPNYMVGLRLVWAPARKVLAPQ